MKSIILLAVLFSISAYSKHFVNVRNEKGQIEVKKINLSDQLLDGHMTESNQVKVVLGLSENPIDLDDSDISDLNKLRAATVFYHITIGLNYFKDQFGRHFPKSGKPLVVRIEMDRGFNEFKKFDNFEGFSPEYNNAVTVPKSGMRKLNGISPWDVEIWFRPPKKEKVKNQFEASGEILAKQHIGFMMLPSSLDQSFQNVLTQAIPRESFSSVDWKGQGTTVVASLVIAEAIPYAMKIFGAPFKVNRFLDTAMLPDVIYHELTHAVLSDKLPPKKNTPILEGLANYFAVIISDLDLVGGKTGKFGKGISKGYSVKDKSAYNLRTERIAHSAFALSLLIDIRERIEGQFKGEGEKIFDQIVFNFRNHMSYSLSPISKDLIGGLIRSSNEVSPKDKRRLINLIIRDTANERGVK